MTESEWTSRRTRRGVAPEPGVFPKGPRQPRAPRRKGPAPRHAAPRPASGAPALSLATPPAGEGGPGRALGSGARSGGRECAGHAFRLARPLRLEAGRGRLSFKRVTSSLGRAVPLAAANPPTRLYCRTVTRRPYSQGRLLAGGAPPRRRGVDGLGDAAATVPCALAREGRLNALVGGW